MNIPKAIETNDATITNKSTLLLPGEIVAIQLGNEALYRCQEFRKYTTPKVYMPLPGETEES